MGATNEIFLRMREQEYLEIPAEIREKFLSSKRVDEYKGDWAENMLDKNFETAYLKLKKAKKVGFLPPICYFS